MDTLTNEPKVSVIMPAFNARLFIDEAIRSVLCQTYKNWELVIINDGSTDGTEDIINRYLYDPRIVYIKSRNKGMASARNSGIKAASGELIAFLDSDDLWLNKKLELQVKYLVKHPEMVFLHSAYSVLSRKKLYAQLIHHPFLAWKLKGAVYDKLAAEGFIMILTVILKKEILFEAGLFDEEMLMGEDWDLWLRIARKYEVGFINKTLAVYRHNPSGMSKDVEKVELAAHRLIEKHSILGILQKKLLSYIYTHIGHTYFYRGAFNEAKTYSLLGIKYYPYNYEPHLLYLKAFIKKNYKSITNTFHFLGMNINKKMITNLKRPLV